jgi:hypothetical protein
MEILRLEEPSYEDDARSPLLKIFLGVGLLTAILGGGFAFASWLGINGTTGPSAKVQFGQGVQATTACDQSLNVTPENGYVQDTGTAGMFTLDSVYVSGIAQACQGGYFTVRVYDSATGTSAYNLTNDASGTYYNYAKVYWPTGGDFQAVDSSYITVESWDTTTPGNAAFRVVLDPDNIDNGQIVDARNIYKVTLDTSSS